MLMATAGSADAQITNAMKFTTTFPFMVGRQSMPAGAYTITPLEIDNSLMQLTNGHTTVLLLTERDRPKAAPRQDEVIFAKRGDTYVLREIWDASTLTGAETIEFHSPHSSHHEKAH